MMKTLLGTLSFFTLLYYSIVRDIRKSDGNALRGLFKEVMTSLIMVGVFYLMMTVLGLRGAAVRGNFVLFLISGIFLYLTHVKAVGKVAGSGSATDPMLKHAPVSTLLLIMSAALSSLYLQILAMIVVLLMAHVIIEPIVFYNLKVSFCAFLSPGFQGLQLVCCFYPLDPTPQH